MKAKVTLKPIKSEHLNTYEVTCEVPYRDTTKHTAWTGSDGRGLWIDGKQAATPAAFDATRNAKAEIQGYFKNYFLPPVY